MLLVALLALLKIFHERLCKILGGKHATGEQRRKAYPPAYPNNHPVIPHKLLRDDSFSGFDMTWHALDGMPSRPSGTRLFYQVRDARNISAYMFYKCEDFIFLLHVLQMQGRVWREPNSTANPLIALQKISPKNVKTKVVLNLVHGLGVFLCKVLPICGISHVLVRAQDLIRMV